MTRYNAPSSMSGDEIVRSTSCLLSIASCCASLGVTSNDARATVKSYQKMRDDALNGDSAAKERYEKTLAVRREAYHTKKIEELI